MPNYTIEQDHHPHMDLPTGNVKQIELGTPNPRGTEVITELKNHAGATPEAVDVPLVHPHHRSFRIGHWELRLHRHGSERFYRVPNPILIENDTTDTVRVYSPSALGRRNNAGPIILSAIGGILLGGGVMLALNHHEADRYRLQFSATDSQGRQVPINIQGKPQAVLTIPSP